MKAKNVIIAGADPDLSCTVHLCLSAYLIPIGIHYVPGDSFAPSEIAIDRKKVQGRAKDDSIYINSLPKTIPVLDEEAFSQAALDQDIEIISGAYGLRDRDHFMRILMYCKNKLKIRKPIRHPAYMLDRLSMDCKGYICAGYPGSGNMLVQSILQYLINYRSAPIIPNPMHDTAKAYASSYWASLSNYIESHFYEAGFWRSQTSPTHQKYGALWIDLAISDRPSMLAGLPVRSYFWANPWAGSHEPPTETAINFFDRYGFKFIFIVRNPLDIIISLAGKTTSFAKQRTVEWLIDNRQWFEDTLSSVVYYYRQAKENRKKLIIVRYEDFLSSPAQAIVHFAKAINITIERDSAAAIWNHLAGATLSADPGHYWQPGEGKWGQYIPIEYKELIENSGILDLAKEFGYAIDLNLLTRKQGDQVSIKKPDEKILALEEMRWFFCTGKPQSISSPDIVIIEDQNLVAATYKSYEKLFRDLLASPILHWLLYAAEDVSTGNFISPPASQKRQIMAHSA